MSAKMTNPLQDQINALINLYNSGQLSKTEHACRQLLQAYPQSFIVLNVLGAALQRQDKHQLAVESYNRAIQLKPDYSEAYNNRGVSFLELGLLEEAVSSYNKAIELQPNSADSYSNRGVAFQELGRLEEAVKSYDKAIKLKPDYADAYSNLGAVLRELGRWEEAVKSYDKAIQFKPNLAQAYYARGSVLLELGSDAALLSYQKALSIEPGNGLFWSGFASAMQTVKFTSCSADLTQCLLQLLEQPTIYPRDLSRTVTRALHLHPVVSQTLEAVNSDSFGANIDSLTVQLSTVPLLLRLMELSLIPDLALEKMLTKMRKAMLNKAVNGEHEIKGLPFCAALAIHCFNNEYVFSEDKKEKQEVELLQEKVKVTLEKNNIIPAEWIAVLGAYRQLYSFSWAYDLLRFEWPAELTKLIKVQVNEVREEQALLSKIPRLASIEDKTSQLVREQYEKNPYPRWIKAGISEKPKKIRQALQSVKHHLNFDALPFKDKPNILIAGCGTGQQALGTASRFQNSDVLALDLSLGSLSYALRKTQELGVSNINYIQGDILNLNQLDREFDIITSLGVLHHMDDPLAGWQVLVDRLRTGGLMHIALYSDIARRHIVAARKQIAEKKYTSSPDDIRLFRDEVINIGTSSDSEMANLTDSIDFYSLSECRDLLFHVQEHRFSLPQIEVVLNHLGLKFLGFEFKDNWIRRKFRELYPDINSLVSLSLWHQFEQKNPTIFAGMYTFWAQKK